MTKFLTLLFICFQLVAAAEIKFGCAQQPLDGRERIFHDELLDNLVGDWKVSIKFKTRTAENTARADWVLNHQFLLIHMKDVNNPPQYICRRYAGAEVVTAPAAAVRLRSKR